MVTVDGGDRNGGSPGMVHGWAALDGWTVGLWSCCARMSSHGEMHKCGGPGCSRWPRRKRPSAWRCRLVEEGLLGIAGHGVAQGCARRQCAKEEID